MEGNNLNFEEVIGYIERFLAKYGDYIPTEELDFIKWQLCLMKNIEYTAKINVKGLIHFINCKNLNEHDCSCQTMLFTAKSILKYIKLYKRIFE